MAFPKSNKVVSLLPHEAKALHKLFCHMTNPIGWLCDEDGEFRLVYGPCHVILKTQNLNPKHKGLPKPTPEHKP